MGKFYSDTLEKGIHILYFQSDKSKYPEGVKLIEEAVDLREPDAYYFLARCYAWGDGNVEENMTKARLLSKQGIDLGSDICVLGADRFSGLTAEIKSSMKHSLYESFEAVKSMAESGNPMAQYAIGLFYFWQDVTEIQQPKSQQEYSVLKAKNALESHKWFKMAATQGCIPAFRNVYASLRDGKNGIVKDLKAAIDYAEKCKKYVDLFYFYYELGEICENLNINKKALQWYEEGFANGDSYCGNRLGNLFLYGEAVKEDQEKAFNYFCMAAKAGNVYSIYNMGRCYDNGWGINKNDNMAFKCFYEAAQQGHADSQRYLAYYFYEGQGGAPVDYSQSFYWANSAVEQGNSAAKYFLGRCYLYGNGVQQNPELAKKYFEENAAECDNDDSYRFIGEMYEVGRGVPVNKDRAIEYYKMAADAGNDDARDDLLRLKGNFFNKWLFRKNKL